MSLFALVLVLGQAMDVTPRTWVERPAPTPEDLTAQAAKVLALINPKARVEPRPEPAPAPQDLIIEQAVLVRLPRP